MIRAIVSVLRTWPYRAALLAVTLLAVLVFRAGWAGWSRPDPVEHARHLVSDGRVREALTLLRSHVRQHPGDGPSRFLLGSLHLRLSDPLSAEKELLAAADLGVDRLKINPQLAETYLTLARYKDALAVVLPENLPPAPQAPGSQVEILKLRSFAQIGLGNLGAARAALAAVEALAPEMPEGALIRSRLAVAENDRVGAERVIDDALAKAPHNAAALLLKVQFMSERGETAAAITIADRAVESAPWDIKPRLARANLLIMVGRDAEAQADVSAVLANFPRSSDATYLRALLRAREGRYVDAWAGFSRLDQLGTRYPRVPYFLAVIAAAQGQPETAVNQARHYVSRVPDDMDGVLLLARAATMANRPEQAIAVLRKALDAGKDTPAVLDTLGLAQVRVGDLAAAIESFQAAVQRDPQNLRVVAHLTLAKLQSDSLTSIVTAIRTGHLDQAEADLSRLKSLVGDTEPLSLLGGQIRLSVADFRGAEIAFSETLRRFPESDASKINLARAMVGQGRFVDAEAVLKDVLAHGPANAPALDVLVGSAMRDKRAHDAILAIEAARKARPHDGRLGLLLADVLVRSGDGRRAIDTIEALSGQQGVSAAMLASRGNAQLAAGLTTEGKDSLRQAWTLAPQDDALLHRLVGLMLRDGETDAASALLGEAIRARPGDLGLKSRLVSIETRARGIETGLRVARSLSQPDTDPADASALASDAWMEAGRYAEAIRAFDAAPLRTFAHVSRLARAQWASGRAEDATRTLSTWLVRNAEDADAAGMLAEFQLRTNKLVEAQAHLEAVIARRPLDAVALNNLAWLYQTIGDPRARVLAQRAHAIEPTAHTADTLGWILLCAGDIKDALPLLQQASAALPENPAILRHLATARSQTQ